MSLHISSFYPFLYFTAQRSQRRIGEEVTEGSYSVPPNGIGLELEDGTSWDTNCSSLLVTRVLFLKPVNGSDNASMIV